MKRVIVIRGPLGAGKTTIAKLIAEKINAFYISLDQLIDDNNLSTNDGIPLENFLKSNEIIKDIVEGKDVPVVIDGCYYYQEQILDLQNKFGGQVFFITINSTLEKCIARDAQRPKVYGEDSATFVYGMVNKIKTEVEIDNTDLTVDETVELVISKIQHD